MDSAHLKIQRAEKHYSELYALFDKKKPFKYFLETNFKTGQRATFAKRDVAVVNEAAIIIGDLIHNLRAAIDHSYWSCTSDFAKSEAEKRNIQFPITSNEDALKKSTLPGLPKRVSESFSEGLASLKPYRENGNKLLCAIHDLDVMDKHKLLIPTGNFTKITSLMLQKQIPDFPSGIMNCGFGNCRRDVVWHVKPMTWTQRRKSKIKIPPSNLIEEELDVPVDIVLNDLDISKPALDVLQELIVVAKNVVNVLNESARQREFAKSP
ncbi:hypothetical protein C9J22_06695 [Photobacterium phosphoreum]|uniref:hypothetical protein n=1 Tax=Photobacterium phosphoreum TaxID=659 RepID=UPI000D15BCFF|nr:hypothetical protein [Photobacterium phosphoreum]PSU71471.1 hypothetical protein C9J22_06695 [Photobacterium phosphoreum]